MDSEKIIGAAMQKLVAAGFKETAENRAFVVAIIEALAEA